MRLLLIMYSVVGLLTFVFQVVIRLEMCSGIAACGLSLAKAVVWSAIWPIYWPVFLHWFG